MGTKAGTGSWYATYIRCIPDFRSDTMGDIELDAGFDFTTSRAARLGARFNLRFTLGTWRV
jgi:hypothetical protein